MHPWLVVHLLCVFCLDCVFFPVSFTVALQPSYSISLVGALCCLFIAFLLDRRICFFSICFWWRSEWVFVPIGFSLRLPSHKTKRNTVKANTLYSFGCRYFSEFLCDRSSSPDNNIFTLNVCRFCWIFHWLWYNHHIFLYFSTFCCLFFPSNSRRRLFLITFCVWLRPLSPPLLVAHSIQLLSCCCCVLSILNWFCV